MACKQLTKPELDALIEQTPFAVGFENEADCFCQQCNQCQWPTGNPDNWPGLGKPNVHDQIRWGDAQAGEPNGYMTSDYMLSGVSSSGRYTWNDGFPEGLPANYRWVLQTTSDNQPGIGGYVSMKFILLACDNGNIVDITNYATTPITPSSGCPIDGIGIKYSSDCSYPGTTIQYGPIPSTMICAD